MALNSHLATHREKLGLQIFLLHSFATCTPQSIGILFVFLLREMDGSNFATPTKMNPSSPLVLQSALMEIKNKIKSMRNRRCNVQKTKTRGALLLQE